MISHFCIFQVKFIFFQLLLDTIVLSIALHYIKKWHKMKLSLIGTFGMTVEDFWANRH